MKKISVIILSFMVMLMFSSVMACENCDCGCKCKENCNCKKECLKDCDCGCQKGEKCKCKKECNCKGNCDCGCKKEGKFKKAFKKFFKRNEIKCNCEEE